MINPENPLILRIPVQTAKSWKSFNQVNQGSDNKITVQTATPFLSEP